MTSKVFITGIAGFLGSHLADAFLNLGYHVSGIDNLLGGSMENLPENVEFRAADCNDLDAYADMLEKCELVYHCAALAYEGLSVFSPHFINTHIANASIGVLSNALAKGVKRLVYCSSMARYGANPVPYTEAQLPRPVDPYGISKVAGELVGRALSDIHGMEFNIAVPHNIIGPRQRYDDPYRNVASIMINRMLQGKQPIIYGSGSQTRCFSFVYDVVPPMVKLGIDANVKNEVVNLGPDKEVITVLELAEQIAELINFKLEPVFVPPRPLEVKTAYCSSDKARKLLGYKTAFNLRTALASMIDWISCKGPKEFHYNFDLEIVNQCTPRTWTQKLI